MATKKTAETKTATKKTTRKAKKDEVLYRGQKYTILEEANGKVKLTDGTIHFWVRGEDLVED